MSDELPQGWIETPLESLAADTKYPIGDGDHGQIKPSTYTHSGIPYIRVGDMGWGKFEPKTLVHIPKSVHEQNLKSELLPGDILIAKTGATIGKCCIIPDSIPKANTTSSVGKVTINRDATSPEWILYNFLSRKFNDQMWAVSHKTAQPGFNIRDLKLFTIPLAPLAEQRRIVAKLEKLLGQVDASQQRLEKLPTLLKRFRQSILAAACSGRLTADWREEHDLAEEWPVEPLSEFFEMRNGKSLVATKRQEGKIPVFGGNGLMGTHNAANAEGLVIVIGRVGAQCGNVHYVTGKVWVTDNAISLQGKKELVPAFYAYFLRSLNLNTMSAGTGQPYVSQEILGPIETPVVSLAEQQEIVWRVAGLFALADQLEQRLAQARKQVDKLTPSLLARAFAGKLVPQDPKDEPAAKLLERIQTGRKVKA